MIGEVQFFSYIVAVESNVEFAIFDGACRQFLLKIFNQSVAEINATRLNANQDCIFKVVVILQYLMT